MLCAIFIINKSINIFAAYIVKDLIGWDLVELFTITFMYR